MFRAVTALMTWVREIFVRRAPGRHSGAHFAQQASAQGPLTGETPAFQADCRQPPRTSTDPVRPRRQHHEVIDGHDVSLVRPYVLALEERRRRAAEDESRRRQRQRRRELALAAMGQDAGPCRIHGVRVAS